MSFPPHPGGKNLGAGWSSPVARQAHNLKVTGSNPVPATNVKPAGSRLAGFFTSNSPHTQNVSDPHDITNSARKAPASRAARRSHKPPRKMAATLMTFLRPGGVIQSISTPH